MAQAIALAVILWGISRNDASTLPSHHRLGRPVAHRSVTHLHSVLDPMRREGFGAPPGKRPLEDAVAAVYCAPSNAPSILRSLAKTFRSPWSLPDATQTAAIQMLVVAVASALPSWTGAKLTIALHSLTHIIRRHRRLLDMRPLSAALQSAVVNGTAMRSLTPSEAARVLWTIPQLNLAAPDAVDVLAGVLVPTAEGLSNPELTMAVWALGACGRAPAAALTALCASVRERELDGRSVANIAWGLATLRHNDQLTLWHVAAQATLRCGALKPQELANVFWAFAVLSMPVPELLDAITASETATDTLNRLNAQEASMVLWSLARLRCLDRRLFARTLHRLLSPAVAPALTPQGLTNVAWACATLGYRHEIFLRHAVQRLAVANALSRFTPQGTTVILWSLAQLSMDAPSLFAAVAEHLQRPGRLDAYGPQDLSFLAWSYASLNHCDPGLFAAVAGRMLDPIVLRNAPLRSLVHLLWAFATAGLPHPLLGAAIAKEIVDRSLVPRCNPTELAAIVWAVARLRAPASAAFLEAILSHARRLGPAAFAPKELAILLWGAAKAAPGFAGILDWVSPFLVSRGVLDPWSPHELSVALAAFALARRRDPGAIQAILHHALLPAVLPTADAVDVTHFTWAMARLRWRRHKPLANFADRALESQVLETFRVSEIAAMLWAHAILRWRNDKLVLGLLDQLEQPVVYHTLTPRDVGTLAWSVVLLTLVAPRPTMPLQRRYEATVLRLAAYAERQGMVGHFDPQAVAALAWALATLRLGDPGGLLGALERRAAGIVDALSPIGLVTTTSSLLRLGLRSNRLTTAAVSRLMEDAAVDSLSPSCAVTALALLTRTRTQNATLFRHILGSLTAPDRLARLPWGRIPHLLAVLVAQRFGESQVLSSIVSRIAQGPCDTLTIIRTTHLLARLGLHSSELLTFLVRQLRVPNIAGFLGPQDAALALWTLASADNTEDQVLTQLLQSVVKGCFETPQPPPVRTLALLHDVLVHLSLRSEFLPLTADLLRQMDHNGVIFQAQCASAYQSLAPSKPTRLAASVGVTLRSMDLRCWKGAQIPDTAYAATLLLPTESVVLLGFDGDPPPVVVEAVGPEQCVSSGEDSWRLAGTVQFRLRLIRWLGYAVAVVPFFEWEALASEGARQAYLLHRIEAAVRGTLPHKEGSKTED